MGAENENIWSGYRQSQNKSSTSSGYMVKVVHLWTGIPLQEHSAITKKSKDSWSIDK